MSGRYSISDLLGRTYWRTNDLRDAFETAHELGRSIDLLVCRNDNNGNTVYMWQGSVSVYVRNGVDVDRVKRAA